MLILILCLPLIGLGIIVIFLIVDDIIIDKYQYPYVLGLEKYWPGTEVMDYDTIKKTLDLKPKKLKIIFRTCLLNMTNGKTIWVSKFDWVRMMRHIRKNNIQIEEVIPY